jgi:hypothetical protein
MLMDRCLIFGNHVVYHENLQGGFSLDSQFETDFWQIFKTKYNAFQIRFYESFKKYCYL